MVLAVVGYGNLGRGAEAAALAAPDAELLGVFTRRAVSAVSSEYGTPVLPLSEISRYRERIDVLLVCAGSATDLPWLTPQLAGEFCCVDSYDTHGRIPEHYAAVERAARAGGTLAVISAGWDPGLFSLARLYGEAALPQGESCTFWGRGVSQGHSEAIRGIPGVLDAREYTVPKPEALEAARAGDCGRFPALRRHRRECFVVAAEGADREKIARAIVTMPEYFAGYETTVSFISGRELEERHSGLPHGGAVIRRGAAGGETHTLEYTLRLGSNPAFTGGVLVAFARAAYRLSRRGESGCRTAFDIAPALLSLRTPEEQRAGLL